MISADTLMYSRLSRPMLLEVSEDDEVAQFLEEGRIVVRKYVKGGNREQ